MIYGKGEDNEEQDDELPDDICALPELMQPQELEINIEGLDQRLPIFQYHRKLISQIQSSQVTVVSGETGCGKSTQVPQYIYRYHKQRGNDRVRIVVTQPRRVAAISLAARVSRELGQAELVGYQVGMDRQADFKQNAIVFMTNGILLQRLVHDKNFLRQIHYLILDEVHERDIDSDFIMVALKHLLATNPRVRIVLMSATINNQLFAHYFAADQIRFFLNQ